jgi:S-DNA-T family DNA segregation ATPase FtsK/SpoIIIE
MYRDERAHLCGYSAHPLPSVLDHLEMAASLVADAFHRVEGPAWERRFVYNWPTAAEHDIAWLGRHAVHEGEHHLMDARRVLSRS